MKSTKSNSKKCYEIVTGKLVVRFNIDYKNHYLREAIDNIASRYVKQFPATNDFTENLNKCLSIIANTVLYFSSRDENRGKNPMSFYDSIKTFIESINSFPRIDGSQGIHLYQIDIKEE